jgi:hypothetical protein
MVAMVMMMAAAEEQAWHAEQSEGEKEMQHMVRSSRRDGRGIEVIRRRGV